MSNNLNTNFNMQDNAIHLINVKQFGAKGDGVNDDTKAIQAAFSRASSQKISTQLRLLDGQKLPYIGSSPMIYFPHGKYKISKTIKTDLYLNVIGDNSILFTKDSIVALKGNMWQCKIEGLQFIGFNQAILADSKNIDQGKVIISNCTFMGSEIAVKVTAQSSIVKIKNNRFSNNKKSLVIQSDKAIVESNWITSGRLEGLRPSQIDIYGVMHFNYNLLVPTIPVKGAREPAWLNNYGTLTVQGVRQGGEAGSFTLINNFAKYDTTYPQWHNGVTVNNSDCYAVYGNRKDYTQPAVIRFFELPNHVEIRGIRGLVDAKLIDYSESVDGSKKSKTINKKFILFDVSNIVKYSSLNTQKYIPYYFHKFLTK